MKTVFIQNNISQALEFAQKQEVNNTQYFFIKSALAKGMRSIKEEENIKFLIEHLAELKIIEESQLSELKTQENIYFGWDAYDEKKLKAAINADTGKQNRLLTNFNYESIKTFTPFRKKVESNFLPRRYKDNIYQPKDKKVEQELSYYFEENHLAQSYFETRNGLIGRNYSTKFSPYLASGRLNVRYLYNYLKNYEKIHGSNKSTYWIQFEILWREYFYWSYQKYQELYFSRNGINGERSFSRELTFLDHKELFKNDPFMTAVSKELIDTGFVSNRLRQVFASSLINQYKIDWRIGASFFESYLIDYDVYSNWGNWQYLAGVGHDPRGSRKFNVLKQLSDHDTNYEYIKKWTGISSSSVIRKMLESIYSLKLL